METKQDVIDQIASLLGTPRRLVSTGSSEPKQIFVDIIDKLELGLDSSASKPELGQRIAHALGEQWDERCDSRATESGGGSTVTLIGLQRLRDGVIGAQRQMPKVLSQATMSLAEAARRYVDEPDDLLAEFEAGGSGPVKLQTFRPLPDPQLDPDAYQIDRDAMHQRVLQEKALRGHRETLNRLAALLETSGARCDEDPASVDLVARWRDGTALLVEVKTVSEGHDVARIRLALAQVFEYAYRLRNELGGKPILAIALDRPLMGPAWLEPFVTEAMGVNLLWPDQNSFRIRGPESRQFVSRVAALRST